MPARIDARAQGCGHDLGAKAQAEGGRTRGEAIGDGVDLFLQPGVAVDLVGADGAAADHEQVGLAQAAAGGVHPGVDDVDAVAALTQGCFEQPQILECNMSQNQGGGHGVYPFLKRCRAASPARPASIMSALVGSGTAVTGWVSCANSSVATPVSCTVKCEPKKDGR